MFADFINRPILGQYPEKHFGAITPNCLWVKFVDKGGEEWIGSFEQSWVEQGTFIIKLDKQEKVFVVSGGQSFLIDVKTRQQLNKTEISDIKTAIVDDEQTHIYYSSGFDLRFMDTNGNDFVLFDNYYFDDIKLVEIRKNKLYATYWNYQSGSEPFHFEIDLLTKEVNDSFYDFNSRKYNHENPKPTLLTKLKKWITN
ncbi:hypothetical protein FNW52_20215 [Flavobacterium sp. ZT3R18]|uniref:hypothetical protein n=1 Tax=Flavobacterium sp. ZT3R18 TaxID=2594429 RepID=UPI001179F548|nr:hypothetical protein [Flavobacterium sp. ZT3R18]TRX30434.1 hypothetical protein FNW52_20215 [Flavobacterium sp. ZT3R18]